MEGEEGVTSATASTVDGSANPNPSPLLHDDRGSDPADEVAEPEIHSLVSDEDHDHDHEQDHNYGHDKEHEHEHEYNHHHSTSDGISQRVNSPCSSGPMTRRAHSFKRNNNNNGNPHRSISSNVIPSTTLSPHCEIELQTNSPRSKIGASFFSTEVLESVLETKHAHHVTQRLHSKAVKSLLKRPIKSFVVDLGLREKKRIGHWMFIVFCGALLFLCVLKIYATGWFGSAIERAESSQDLSDSIASLNLREQRTNGHGHGYRD